MLKKLIRKAHLFPGISSGIIVFIISITGCLYAFQEEIQNLTQNYRFVNAENKAFLPPSVLSTIAGDQLPEKHLHAIQYFKNNKAAEAIFYDFDPAYYFIIYLNPYSGEVLKVKDMDADFFRIVLMGHFYLWLPPDVGRPIIASATLIFIVLLITGIVLWWPKNRKVSKQRFSVKWAASWRRKNFDLHSVLGFYAYFVLLMLAITGLVWGFDWFKESYYQLAGGEKPLDYIEPVSLQKDDATEQGIPSIDKVWNIMQEEYPLAYSIEVHPPETDSSSIAANANLDEGTYWKLDYRYFNQYSLEELSVDHIFGRFEEANTGERLMRMNYDIHTGAIFGIVGKILMFFASLICASLPVTGFLLWWGRNKKKNKTTKNIKYNKVKNQRYKFEEAMI